MKIYTKTGDDGSTGLFGGERVPKSDPRIDCSGTIDELNAALGIAAVTASEDISLLIHSVQNDLFVLGAHLSTPTERQNKSLPALEDVIVQRLEMQIDSAEAELTPLRNFILPGGTETAARLHFARTVCRRAERLLVEFSQNRPVPGTLLTYLNRLSDWLFVQARLTNTRAGVDDILWQTR